MKTEHSRIWTEAVLVFSPTGHLTTWRWGQIWT